MTTPPVKDDKYWNNGEGIHDPENPYNSQDNLPGSDNYDRELAALDANIRRLRKDLKTSSAEEAAALTRAIQAFETNAYTRRQERAGKETDLQRRKRERAEFEDSPYRRRERAVQAQKDFRDLSDEKRLQYFDSLVPLAGGYVRDKKNNLYYALVYKSDPNRTSPRIEMSEDDTDKLLKAIVKALSSEGADLYKLFKTGEWPSRYDGDGLYRTTEQNSKAQVQVAEESQKATQEPPPQLPKYIQNIQALLINDIDTISENFRRFDAKNGGVNSKDILALDNQFEAGAFMNRMSGFATPHGMMSSFIHATPAQLSLLVPTMRFFMVDSEGKEEEIYFSDYGDAEHIKKMAKIRRDGSIYEFFGSKAQKGAQAGISSFEWSINTAHEGDFTFDATLDLYFGSLAELANKNYLQFIFPTGLEEPEALKVQDPHRNQFRESAGETPREKLTKEIAELSETLSKSEAEIKKVSLSKNQRASVKRNYRNLKVLCGWALPAGNEAQMKKLFPNDNRGNRYKSFMAGIKATTRAYLLAYKGHNINFTQEGPTTLTVDYTASLLSYLKNSSSDIFGSSNFSKNSRMWDLTKVSIEGFRMYKGSIVDSKAADANSSKKDKATYQVGRQVSALELDEDAAFSPYIKNAAKTRFIDDQGEASIKLSMGGLYMAADLVRKQLALQEMNNAKPDSRRVTQLRRMGTIISLLSERIRMKQKRALYASFLETMVKEKDRIFKARVVLAPDAQTKVKILYDQKEIEKRDRKREMRNETDVAKQEKLKEQKQKEQDLGMSLFAPEDPPLPPEQNEIDVYYMRLGDIIKTACENAEMRDDITFVLGNHETKTGFRYSIYDIPVTVGTFGQLFYDNIVNVGATQFPIQNFVNLLLKYVTNMFNRDPSSSERITFQSSQITTKTTVGDFTKKQERLSVSDLRKIGKGELDPGVRTRFKLHHYYAISTKNTDLDRLVGNRKKDESEGIYHYVIGSDTGLAKRFNFKASEIPFYTEMNIEAGTDLSVNRSVFLPQDVSIDMVGNGIHKVGDMIFVDSDPAMGSYAGPILGIGGYYNIVSINNSIRAGQTYSSVLECLLQKKDPRGTGGG